MRKPTLVFKRLKIIDFVVFATYIIISLFVYFTYIYNKNIIKEGFSPVLFYGFFTQFTIIHFLYPLLRNFSHYIFWVIVGMFHLFLYYQLIEFPMTVLTRIIHKKVAK